jgi:hypothetical protein
MIHREAFLRDYELFWLRLPVDYAKLGDHPRENGDLVALIFVILAMGTQFVPLPSADQKEQSAEFHGSYIIAPNLAPTLLICKVSASHQALRVFSYLGKPSIRTIQTMVLIIYFLMNDNHAADAFAFAGILVRHAYALGLNRDPSRFCPKASLCEKQTRRKLWQAIFFQDTFLTILLALPPTATHTDVRIEDLHPETDNSLTQANPTDVSYISSMWHLAKIVQDTLCSPRALDLPISKSQAERTRLVDDFRRIYASFPEPLRTFSEIGICDLARRSKRLARQALFLTSNYFHCLMLVYAEQHANLRRDVNGTLNAAHDAISSFFLLHTLFQEEAKVWYHFSHRAFLEAVNLISGPCSRRSIILTRAFSK